VPLRLISLVYVILDAANGKVVASDAHWSLE
jgi:hypothetical protein